ncbi:MAG: hypothetical protein Q4F05_09550 [bacterium]|nr:hypothetical protein [bacterium]
MVFTSSNLQELSAFHRECLRHEKVDEINSGFSQTKLTIEEYLVFYGIANSVYGNEYVQAIKNYLVEHQLLDYYYEPICSLTCKQQLLVRLFITKYKSARIVLLNNMDGALFDGDLYAVIRCMQSLTRQAGIQCYVTTKSSPMIRRYKGQLCQL